MTILARTVEFLDVWKDFLAHLVRSHNEDCHVHNFSDDASIGNHLDWRTVEEDVVILSSQFLDHLLETISEENLSWIWRKGSDWEDIEV